MCEEINGLIQGCKITNFNDPHKEIPSFGEEMAKVLIRFGIKHLTSYPELGSDTFIGFRDGQFLIEGVRIQGSWEPEREGTE